MNACNEMFQRIMDYFEVYRKPSHVITLFYNRDVWPQQSGTKRN